MMQLQFRLALGEAGGQAAKVVDKLHLHQDKTTPPTPGNVFEPMPEGTTETGGWEADGTSTARKMATADAAAAIPATALLCHPRPVPVGADHGAVDRSKDRSVIRNSFLLVDFGRVVAPGKAEHRRADTLRISFRIRLLPSAVGPAPRQRKWVWTSLPPRPDYAPFQVY